MLSRTTKEPLTLGSPSYNSRPSRDVLFKSKVVRRQEGQMLENRIRESEKPYGMGARCLLSPGTAQQVRAKPYEDDGYHRWWDDKSKSIGHASPTLRRK